MCGALGSCRLSAGGENSHTTRLPKVWVVPHPFPFLVFFILTSSASIRPVCTRRTYADMEILDILKDRNAALEGLADEGLIQAGPAQISNIHKTSKILAQCVQDLEQENQELRATRDSLLEI